MTMHRSRWTRWTRWHGCLFLLGKEIGIGGLDGQIDPTLLIYFTDDDGDFVAFFHIGCGIFHAETGHFGNVDEKIGRAHV